MNISDENKILQYKSEYKYAKSQAMVIQFSHH